MVAAMAFRVKYREYGLDGLPVKRFLRIVDLGVHKKNRGGNFPAGVRCKGLCVDVVIAGFLKEEVNHACIAVQEAPSHAFPQGGLLTSSGMEMAKDYNAEQSAKDELLCGCFVVPYNDVRYAMLSHNHMMLVLRAFLTRAKWDLPPCEEKGVFFCDTEGRLSVTAVAASANGKEIQEVMTEGLLVEVLSWKMDVEEPTAAAIISAAMNQPQQMSMRATELTAVAVLKGEIIVQMGKDLSQRVAFQTVRERVRAELHTAADEPDLPAIFDFLISNGVGKNTYIEGLLEWTSTFVDSKKRQLRFSAFTVLNQMHKCAVHSRMAVAKRAYRKPPKGGFCASPEPFWHQVPWAHLQLLEEVLRFFHGSCKGILEKMSPQSRILLLGNVDVAAAEAFFVAKDPQLWALNEKKGVQRTQEVLLAATRKYLPQLGLEPNGTTFSNLEGVASWITWKDAEPVPCAPTAAEVTSAPAVIGFEESTGRQLNQQVGFDRSVAEAPRARKVPWRQWLRTSTIGETEADHAAAVAVLHSTKTNFAGEDEPVEVWDKGGKVTCTATRKIHREEMTLPCSVPKQSKVYAKSEHPHAVALKINVLKRAGASTPGTKDTTPANVTRSATVFLHPEFRNPKRMATTPGPSAVAETRPPDDTAVAGGAPLAAPGDASGSDAEWDWGPGGHTMLPFWAVRRLTAKALETDAASKSSGGRRPRFNCRLSSVAVSNVTVGVVKAQTLTTTRMVDVPFLTNSSEVEAGEELILEIAAPKLKAAPKRTWQAAMKEDENKAKKLKVDHESY
jgi:hypothetical protein